ncbi:MAG: hypothetical protein QXN21_04640 [Candidatus Bathyarchaeia archaeon]
MLSLQACGNTFLINGKPIFLVGISYYGALGASESFIENDLLDMKRYGFKWFRVWATWAAFGKDVSAVNTKGKPRYPYFNKLEWIVKLAEEMGLIVDVTLSRGNHISGPPRLQSTEALRQAAETITRQLRDYKNWYLDMANEHNIGDERFVSFEELRSIRDAIKVLDPHRLITSSHAGDLSKEEVKRYLLEVEVDFISPHRPRHPASPKETGDKTKLYVEWMKDIGRIVPIHYQEPFRRGFTPQKWEPKAEDFLIDLDSAYRNGAAGWCFHNGDQKDKPDGKPRRCFDLSENRLFEQLDGEEFEALNAIKDWFKRFKSEYPAPIKVSDDKL